MPELHLLLQAARRRSVPAQTQGAQRTEKIEAKIPVNVSTDPEPSLKPQNKVLQHLRHLNCFQYNMGNRMYFL